jgi:hypothetical protein
MLKLLSSGTFDNIVDKIFFLAMVSGSPTKNDLGILRRKAESTSKGRFVALMDSEVEALVN